jgi:carbamoyltransferase
MILGISAFYHDSAAALVDHEGRVVAAAQEERFSRLKHDARFPRHAIRHCLDRAGVGIEDLELVAFYEKPWVKFERILETQLAYAPRGFRPFLKAMPIWLKEKLWIGRMIEKELGYEGRIIYPEHHESHAASAFFASPFRRAAILTMDGVGEWATSAWGTGADSRISLTRELHFPHSLGLLYSAFTYYTGFTVNSGEYKVMGLAPYGQPRYVDRILQELIDLKPDGSFRLNMDHFAYGHGLTMTSSSFHELFGGPPREPESELTQRHMDLARSVQEVVEEVMLRMARHVRSETGERQLCMAGGVALNSVGNGRIIREGIFDDVWIQPAAGDAGGSLGAALFAYHHVLGRERRVDGVHDAQRGSYLGPAFDAAEIGTWLEEAGLPHTSLDDREAPRTVASLIAERNVVGWFSGRMEFGPRALGARSILADPRDPEAQARLNAKIKFRESFRPFAPACLAERAPEYFELEGASPYMLVVAPVREEHRRRGGDRLQGLDRLKAPLSVIPAVTHVDHTARVQTVGTATHPAFRGLLESFEEDTGCPMVVNTSFNRRGEPIVCTPADAYECFMRTEMDVLVLEGHLLFKEDQPPVGSLPFQAFRGRWSDRFEPPPPTEAEHRAETRRFGLLMAGAFGVLGGVLAWRGAPIGSYLLGGAALFALAALLAPRALGPVQRGWMWFAERLAVVTNVILLAVVYVLAITPTAVASRLFGRDRLGLKEGTADSWWVIPDREGAADRYDRPY